MHSNEIKDKFVELRAAGKSFGEISEELNVAKSTLHPWEDDRADDIARLRRIQWEETEKSLGRRLEDDLETLAARLCDWEDLMNGVNLNGNFSLRDILFVLRETRREYRHLRAMLMGTLQRRKKSVEPVTPDVRRGLTSPETLDNAATQPAEAVEGSRSKTSPSSPPSLLPSVESPSPCPKPNKTERSAENTETQPRNTNDLQQPESESFDFPGARPSPVAAPLAGSTTITEPNSTSASSNHPSSPPSLLPSLETPSPCPKPNETERFQQSGTR